MTVNDYAGSPPHVINVTAADIHVQADRVGAAVGPNSFFVQLGNFQSGKNLFEFHTFFSFDLPITEDAKIIGVKFSGYSSGAAGGASNFDITGGFLIPEHPSGTGRAWHDSAGFYEWADDSDVPFAEWNNGVSSSLGGIWYGNTPAFSSVRSHQSATVGAEISWGDGLTATTTVTGLVSKLQGYIDANEALRGHRVAGAIPVCLYLYLPYNGVQNCYQDMWVQEFGSPPPKLTVEWTPAPTGARARAFLGPAVSARASIQTTVSARASVGPRISARPVIV